jgi:hypothetical protein
VLSGFGAGGISVLPAVPMMIVSSGATVGAALADGLPLVPAVGAGALVSLFVLMIYTGRLVPRREYDRAVARADKWEQVALEALRQNGQLMVTAQVTTDVMRAVGVNVAAERTAPPSAQNGTPPAAAGTATVSTAAPVPAEGTT